MLSHRPRNAPSQSERGSVVIGVTVLMLVVLVGTALFTRTQVELRSTVSEVNGVVAQAGAEQGVAEVLALIESGERGDFSNSGAFAGGTYRYSVKAESETAFVVRSEADVDGETRAVEVRIEGADAASANYSLFIENKASIKGNVGTIAGRVAINGEVQASGTLVGDVVDLYGPDARCSGCGPATKFEEALSVPPPDVPTGRTRDCPSNGVFTGTIDGQNGAPYVCDPSHVWGSRLQFTGEVNVINPPLIVYVRTGLDIRIRNASVNKGGEIEDFQLYGEGDDDYWWYDVWNSTIRGVLYAPGRDSLLQYATIEGQVSFGVLWITSPYSVWINAEDAGLELEPVSGGWTVTSFERVPAS